MVPLAEERAKGTGARLAPERKADVMTRDSAGSSTGKDIDRQIAAEISWARTHDRHARTQRAREAFLARFERQVDPDGELPEHERRVRAEHAKRAYMLQLAKRSVRARRVARRVPPPRAAEAG